MRTIMATNIVWIMCVVAICVHPVDGVMIRAKRSTNAKECIDRCHNNFTGCFETIYECPAFKNTSPEDAAKFCLEQLEKCIKDCHERVSQKTN
ncbi:hypothetical protein LSAT2_016722 [Lamellibrachia satsuma]|nr:hypothetical protein LSAT2_016722 [Lamellibrachia satsuma]